ncbi:hypothetical protein X847_2398 [Listeria monocytogenes Lm_1889]|nr:hypothetical protein X847_2398 [Listeria monocytogenes Lm_1889]
MLPFFKKLATFSAGFRQTTQLMKSASCSPCAFLNGRFTANVKVATAAPAGVYRKSGSLVNRPTSTTRFIIIYSPPISQLRSQDTV